MPERCLYRGFRKAGVGRNTLQTDRHPVAVSAGTATEQEEVDEKGRRASIVADQIRQKRVDDVRVEGQLCPHSVNHYSD